MILLKEDTEDKYMHIYQDSATGDQYYFDGKKLVLFKKAPEKLEIGYSGTEEELADELARHEEEIEREKAEHPEAYKDETEEERQARFDRLRNAFEDESTIDDFDNETKKVLSKEAEKQAKEIEAQDKQNRSYYRNSGNIDAFKLDLKKFIGNLVDPKRKRTWKSENQRYSGSGLIRRNTSRERKESIPTINIYYDQSGSWGPSDIAVGDAAISVIQKYEDKGQLKKNVYYFSDIITGDRNDNRLGRNTKAGRLVMEHIAATKPQNVIVMTDHDFDRFGPYDSDSCLNGPSVTVPGAVWFLFKDGDETLNLQKKLRGRKQTKKYFI